MNPEYPVHFNSFKKSDTGISTVVSVVLLLGLIVTMVSVYQVSYIPVWKSDAEHAHMDDVIEDMYKVKSNIDFISAGTLLYPDTNILLGVPVKMGGGDIPVIAPSKSSGRLSVNYNDYGISVLATNTSGTVFDSSVNLLNLGTISYYSNNDYYLNQVFEYENGALIVVQGNRCSMKYSPSINLEMIDGVNLSVEIRGLNINGAKKSISSTGIHEIWTKTNSSIELYNSDDAISEVEIQIQTLCHETWGDFLNRSAKQNGLQQGTNYNTVLNEDGLTFTINAAGAVENIKLQVRKVTVDVWIDAI